MTALTSCPSHQVASRTCLGETKVTFRVVIGAYRSTVVDEGEARPLVAQSVATIIDRLGERAPAVIEAIQSHLASEIVELRDDVQLLDLLRASVAGNVETVFDALRYAIDIERVEPPTAALEYARRVAQHAIPVNALVRAYRLGQQEMLAHVLEEIRHADLDPRTALDAFETISRVTFHYIDWISQQVIDTYELERERWLDNRNSLRALRVRELLDVPEEHLDQVDLDAATTSLRYPLRRNHLALILWFGEDEAPGRELLRLEHFLRELTSALDVRDAALFTAADRVSGWAWLPLEAVADPIPRIQEFAAATDTAPHLALGTVQPGLLGFRRSHRQAQDARRVAIAGQRGRRVTAASDPGVAAAALLTSDLAQTREWVWQTLGPLARDSESEARLRETLRVFLREGSSHKAAAQLLNLHTNSVKYRVQRAIECRARPITGDRLDVELALLACHQFGTAVLLPKSDPVQQQADV